MADLSIIVPLYSAKEHIVALLESIDNLKHSKEVLLVDDGSPDDTFAYVNSYISKSGKNDYKLYQKENGGVASARNYGLACANGKFIMFADQDDLIQADVIDDSIEKLETWGGDVCFWSSARLFDNDQKPCDTVYEEGWIEQERIKKELIEHCLWGKKITCISSIGHLWCVLFSRKIIDKFNIVFRSIISYEDDFLFVFESLVHSKMVYLNPGIGYYWRANQNSLSNKVYIVPDRWKKQMKYKEYIYELVKDIGLQDQALINFEAKTIQISAYSIINERCNYNYFTFNEAYQIWKLLRKPEIYKYLRYNFSGHVDFGKWSGFHVRLLRKGHIFVSIVVTVLYTYFKSMRGK